jgi:uncharacterized lipoprotein
MFKEHSDYYKGAQEGRPLEVPPDLDTPPSANELLVPGPGGSATASGTTAAPAAAPPAGAMVAVGGNELHRPENVADTFDKVGSALQRSDIGKVSHKDEAGHSFTFDFDAPMKKEDSNWFKHLLGFDEGEPIKQQLTIFVVDDNGGSRIVVTSPVNSTASAYAQRRTAKELEKYVPDAKIIESAPATATTAAASPAAAPPAMAAAPSSAPPAAATSSAAVAAAGNELHRAENVQDTWEKVGSALQRSDLGKVSNRDEAGHAFAFDFDAPMRKEDSNWFKRVLGFDEGEHVKQTLSVRVVDDNGGSRIVVVSPTNDTAGVYAQHRTAQELAKYVPGASLVESAPAVTTAPLAAPVAATTAPLAAPPPASPPVASAPVAATPSTAPPAMSSAPPGTSNVSSVGGSELHVADSVQNTYARVGLALERAQLGTLSARDDGAHTYTLNFSGTVVTSPEGEHHWYSRVLHPFGGDKEQTQQVTRQLLVRVAGEGAGSKVSVEGDTSDKLTADAAKKVIEVLRDRLS